MIKKLLNNNVFKNFSYLTLGTVFSQLLSLFAILKLTSFLEPNNYGLFTFIIAQGLLLTHIGDLGNRNIIIRTIARDATRAKDLVVNGLKIRILAIVALFAVYIAYNHFFGQLKWETLGLVFIYALTSCFANLFEMVFLANEKMLPSSIINLTHSILWFVIVFTMIDDTVDVTLLFIYYVIISFIKTGLFIYFLNHFKLLKGKVLGFMESTKQLLEESWPYFVIILIMLPLTSFANNFLDVNSTNQEIGYFNLSQKLIGPMSLVISMMLTAVFPNLSALWVKNRDKFKNVLETGLGFYLLFSMIACFIFTLFAKELVVWLFPEGYYPAIAVCQMQVWYLFLTSIDSIVGVILGAANREKLLLRFGILYFLLCTPSLFYGSYFGALGLSYGYVISFGIGTLYVWYTFKKVLVLKVKNDVLLWLLAGGLFGISFFFTEFKFIYKILIALGILGTILPIAYKNYKPMLAK